jgi:phosphatidylserine decarboxylase
MNTILTKIETSQDAVNFLVKNATEENWNSIEESIIMAKFKADLNLEKELFDALDWPLDREAYLKYLHKFERWTPLQSKNKVWNKKGVNQNQEVYDRLCHFYYLIDQPTGIGILKDSISWFSKYLLHFTENWGSYMNSSHSFNKDLLSFHLKHTPQYKIEDSLIRGNSKNEWKCFNDFFIRELNPGLRTIANLSDNRTITCPADSTFKQKTTIDLNSHTKAITVKHTHTFDNIIELLKESSYASEFANGTLVHYSVQAHSYHRFHAPVCGLVKESYPVYDVKNFDIDIRQDGVFATSNNGVNAYQFSQSRGVLILDTTNSPQGDMGIVAVVPIGMSQISSVHMLATPDTVVDKGQEIGYFKYGGSDVILIFQEGKAPKIETSNTLRHYGTSISQSPKN